MSDDKKDKPAAGVNRRSLLIGAGIGAGVTGAAAGGYFAFQNMTRKVRTPAAVEGGGPAEIADSFADSRPSYGERVTPQAGAPNVVVIVLDDVGFADLGCYGSEISTPNFDALAAKGLRYSNFRTCAMCSPTRAALMTGLNHHSAGMGWLADLDSGYPGYRGDMTLEAATLAEVLRDAGWSTRHVGKWHVNLAESNSANGPMHNWPTARGFEQAYWFQGHSTDYFHPSELMDGTAPVEPPEEDDFYAQDHLVDRAIAYLRTQKTIDPERPFYLQLCFPGVHSPLQARARDRDAYKGRYDKGWDAVRAERLARQKELGLVPATTELPPLSPGAESWDSHSEAERRIFARYMEVYAGLLSNLDANVGRLTAALEDLGVAENTLIIVISDNGGSAEGTPTGTPNVFAPAFGRPVPVDEAAELYDIMGEDPTFPHYPVGWACASNTPFKLYKQYAHLGGVADPLIVSWPTRIKDAGAIRDKFVHVIDLYPTILEAAGVTRPETYRGRRLKPVEGASMLATLTDGAAATRTSQYFELGGQRGYMDGNWRLTTRHARGSNFDDDVWELYDLSTDFNETKDLAAQHPEKVAELKAKWVEAAEKHNVFPLDDRNLIIKMVQDRQRRGIRPNWELKPPLDRLHSQAAPLVCGFGHRIEAEIVRPAGKGNGVILAHGSKHAGYVLHIREGKLVYEQSLLPFLERIESPDVLPEGPITIVYEQTMTSRPFDGSGALFVNGTKVAEHTFARVLFSTSYDGFSLGADLGNSVSSLYRSPNPFEGEIKVVRITVDNSPSSPIEQMRFIDAIGIKV